MIGPVAGYVMDCIEQGINPDQYFQAYFMAKSRGLPWRECQDIANMADLAMRCDQSHMVPSFRITKPLSANAWLASYWAGH